jgi:hypothetical protein
MIVHTGMPLLTENDLNIHLRILREAASERERRKEPPLKRFFPAEVEAQVKTLLDRV